MRSVLVLSVALLVFPVAASATPAGVPAHPRPVQPAVLPNVESQTQLHLEQVKIEHTHEDDATEGAVRFPRGAKWWLIAGAIAVKAVILILVL